MPKDNIERAIAKGTGADQDAEAFETVTYEGYGPSGVAVLVEALTDNRNRTSSDVRHAFTKHGGSLGEPGSVAWIFEKKGQIVIDAARYGEDDLMAAVDAGAEDVTQDGDVLEVVTGPTDLAAVRGALEEAGVEIQSAEQVMRPTNRIELDESQATTLMRLLDVLDESDDVQAVHANFDVDADILERVLAG
jgi:YebC/PmpR family DNA-binding regulatory protein